MRKGVPPQAKNKKADTSAVEEEHLPETGNNTFNMANGSKYEGDWKRFENILKRHGKGVFTCEEFTYEGDFEEDLFHGKGFIKFKDGSNYIGDFRHGAITGKGKYTFVDGSTYEGAFRDGKMHGIGLFCTVYGDKWRGPWNNGLSACPIYPQAPPEPVFEEEEEDEFFEEEMMPDQGEMEGEMEGEGEY